MAATTEELTMEGRLWAGYLTVMNAYGVELCRLLSAKLWCGPNGFKGRWTFEGVGPDGKRFNQSWLRR